MLAIIVFSSTVVAILTWLVVRARHSTTDLGSLSERWVAEHGADG